MERVVIVGAGLYGLIAAKTYLQVNGVYDHDEEMKDATVTETEIPSCFTDKTHISERGPGCSLLVIDSASDIGGTWAEERLYPNLLSQNSYGLYEFSDLSLTDVVPPDEDGPGQQFIAGWKINRYLHAWTEKWELKKHIRLNWRVDSIRRLKGREWQLNICITSDSNRKISIVCDKLILATGLTSVPRFPDVESLPKSKKTNSVIHAKDIGNWARQNLGYHPLPTPKTEENSMPQQEPRSRQLRSVAIHGGAKSSFDLVHFFATLHQHDQRAHLNVTPQNPVQIHWIIRKKGTGPSWMAPPMSTLPTGEVVPSDKAASSRFLHYLDPYCSEIPKRVVCRKVKGGYFWSLRMEGSWWARMLHGNPVGRWLIRWFWGSLDRELEGTAQYIKDSKMGMLRPSYSVVSCNSTIGIANQANLWETIRNSHVNIYRSTIQSISSPDDEDANERNDGVIVTLGGGAYLEDVDLVVHATGYEPIVPIRFEPYFLRLQLGISDILNHQPDLETEYDMEGETMDRADSENAKRMHHWQKLDQRSKEQITRTLIDNGCSLESCDASSGTQQSQMVPFRLFRRMVAPELVAEGDRSFAVLGIILTSTIAVVAEVQALWVAAFLTGGMDDSRSCPLDSHHLDLFSRDRMAESIANNVAIGEVTGSGLQVDAIHYNDILMQDLGLNPHRLGGGRWRELTGVYQPSAYAGIVDEWRGREATR